MTSHDPLATFADVLAKLRSRWRRVQLLEGATLGLALGMLGSAILQVVLTLSSRNSLVPTVAVIGFSTIAGVLFALRRRCDERLVAERVDRQLNLSDLFSSAWLVRDRTDDGFSRAVIATACRRAGMIRVDDVAFGRIPPRAIAAVSLLAIATVASSALFTAASGHAATSRHSRSATEGFARLVQAQPVVTDRRSQPDPSFAGSGSDRRPGSSTDSSLTGSPARIASAQPGEWRRFEGRADAAPSVDDASGSGTGASRSESSQARSEQRAGMVTLAASRAAAAGEFQAVTRGADGRGRATVFTAADGTRSSSAGTVVPVPSQSQPAVWNTDAWPGARERAIFEINSGRIPPQYQAIVREYFAR